MLFKNWKYVFKYIYQSILIFSVFKASYFNVNTQYVLNSDNWQLAQTPILATVPITYPNPKFDQDKQGTN